MGAVGTLNSLTPTGGPAKRKKKDKRNKTSGEDPNEPEQ